MRNNPFTREEIEFVVSYLNSHNYMSIKDTQIKLSSDHISYLMDCIQTTDMVLERICFSPESTDEQKQEATEAMRLGVELYQAIINSIAANNVNDANYC
jgi:hypothetical protein